MSGQGDQSIEWRYGDLGGNVPEMYERYVVPTRFAPLADRIAERVIPDEDDRGLDVARGTRNVARRAAPSVGEDELVVEIDSNEGVLEGAGVVSSETRPAVEWGQGIPRTSRYPTPSISSAASRACSTFRSPTTAPGEMHHGEGLE